ncbi:MAG TPA: UDPGP type 1 family protein [Gemmataceae bacterium]|jgi:UDP-N-acetylglucosamine/UDP-N-acetylgalactosamine diphosphorylase|nr:UDPGP type 1 family protein [Gemmataceae bacterium]
MDRVPEAIDRLLKQYGQEHVLEGWRKLDPERRRVFVQELKQLDISELRALYERRHEKTTLPLAESIAPLPRPAEGHDAELRLSGTLAFKRGEIAFLIVAGGQGTRLGFDHPKGMFEVGPVSKRTLFQIHAEKVLALNRRFGHDFPLLLMTSPATHDETVAFFVEKNWFGLPKASVVFFQQGTMPALDLATGKLLVEEPGRLFLGPNGHGGTLTGLADHGLLDELGRRGIRTIYYFQVDNPLVHLADYVFVGRHLAKRAEVSSKVVAKQFPTEKLGNLALIDGRCGIIEYSDLPEELARATDDRGRPKLWAGNPAIHLFDVGFLQRVVGGAERIPWHIAKKKVPHLGDPAPAKENALKFERFIFDVLPLADRWTVTATTRPEEFEPLKNAEGPESPATVRQAIIEQAGRWLEHAGAKVPRNAEGKVAVPIEISPLVALEAADLEGKIPTGTRFDQPTYLQP